MSLGFIPSNTKINKLKAKVILKVNKKTLENIRLYECYYYTITKSKPEYSIFPLNMILPYLASKKVLNFLQDDSRKVCSKFVKV